MKKAVFACVYILSIVVFFTACSKKDAGKQTHQPNVYIIGTSGDSSICWKNGQAIVLSTDANIYPTCITTSGNDVYVAGINYASYPYKIVYWKNGQQFTVTNNSISAPLCIAVSGNDIYINDGGSYWKNGQQYPLLDDNRLPYAMQATTVMGEDVYMTGVSSGIPTIQGTIFLSAAYWKNGERVLFHDVEQNMSISINGIAVSKAGDVCVLGQFGGGFVGYWKNGQITFLSNNTNAHIFSTSGIAVTNNGDVYVSGVIGLSSPTIAVYWKNGQQVSLGNGSANGITTCSNDVYISGTVPIEGGRHMAVYWKNGEQVNISPIDNLPTSNTIAVQ